MTTETDSLVRWVGAQLDADERRERGKYLIHGSTVFKCPQCPNTAYAVTEHSRVVTFDPCGHTMDGEEFVKTFGTPDPDLFVLADIAVKRQILRAHVLRPWPSRLGKGIDCTECGEPVGRESACRTVRLLVLPYAGRDGYEERWRP